MHQIISVRWRGRFPAVVIVLIIAADREGVGELLAPRRSSDDQRQIGLSQKSVDGVFKFFAFNDRDFDGFDIAWSKIDKHLYDGITDSRDKNKCLCIK